MFESVEVYTRTIDWEARLGCELPHIDALIANHHGNNTRPVKVLDLGCGPGFHLIELAKRHPDVEFTGVDIDTAMIGHASGLASKENVQIRLVASDFIENPPENSGAFDVIYCLGNSLSLIWGCGNVQATIESIACSLSTGGDFFFQILNNENPRSGYMLSKIVTLLDGTEVFTGKRFSPDRMHGVMLVDFITFHKKPGDKSFTVDVESASWTLIPWKSIENALLAARLCIQSAWGTYSKDPFVVSKSNDLICWTRKN